MTRVLSFEEEESEPTTLTAFTGHSIDVHWTSTLAFTKHGNVPGSLIRFHWGVPTSSCLFFAEHATLFLATQSATAKNAL